MNEVSRIGNGTAAISRKVIVTMVAVNPAPAEGHAAAHTDWREDYAYTLGVQAYIFGFPYAHMPTIRWNWVARPNEGAIHYAALNHFHHTRQLTDATDRQGMSPNDDTLYSFAWVDVSREPVILSHPDMGDRYFTFQLASLDSDNFGYVGKRATGSNAGSFAIVGPGWQGQLPAGISALPPSRTRSVMIAGRTLTDGPADVPAVNALQDQYTLVPLSYWGKKDAQLPASHDVWAPFDGKSDPLAEWKTMNRAMTEDPPEARLAKLVELFARVGVGPNQAVERMDDATKRGLARAAADGRKLLNAAFHSGLLGKRMNNWTIPPRALGHAGLADDFLLRSAVQCLAGIVANDAEEAVYFNTTIDGNGDTFDGSKRYTIRFAPDRLPAVEGFWSLTLYDSTFNFTPNAINRYSIGDRTRGVTKDPDGGLTIYIQNAPPKGHESNWLPSTANGSFILAMRTYLPGEAIVQQDWAPPPVTQVQ